jgi:hypothetical protein
MEGLELMRSSPPSLFDVLVNAEAPPPAREAASGPPDALAALPEGYERRGRWALWRPATGDCIAKLMVQGEAGYLAWLCTGQGAGYRGSDVGHFLRGCWPNAAGAAGAIAQARGGAELAQGP